MCAPALAAPMDGNRPRAGKASVVGETAPDLPVTATKLSSAASTHPVLPRAPGTGRPAGTARGWHGSQRAAASGLLVLVINDQDFDPMLHVHE